MVVCELAYYTGAFAAYGPSLSNDVRFAVEDVVNTDPPLGRTWELISEDIGYMAVVRDTEGNVIALHARSK